MRVQKSACGVQLKSNNNDLFCKNFYCFKVDRLVRIAQFELEKPYLLSYHCCVCVCVIVYNIYLMVWSYEPYNVRVLILELFSKTRNVILELNLL